MLSEKLRKKLRKNVMKSVAGKQALQSFFEELHRLSLAGMHLGGGDNISTSGEKNVIGFLARRAAGGDPVVFDVGSNVGEYASEVLKVFGSRAGIFCFEPLEKAFGSLKESMAERSNVRAYNFGFGEEDGPATIYADGEGSKIASTFIRKIDHLGVELKYREEVRLRRLDAFCAENGIGHIDLLKIDVEGGELAVLKGAGAMLGSGAIDLIQFEFGPCNIASRTFFQDFFTLLDPGYRIHRIVKDGFRVVERYSEEYEVFMTTNYLAVSRHPQRKKE